MGSEYASDYKVKEIITEIIEWFVVIDVIQIKTDQMKKEENNNFASRTRNKNNKKKNDTQNKIMILKLCIIDLNFIDTHWRKQM